MVFGDAAFSDVARNLCIWFGTVTNCETHPLFRDEFNFVPLIRFRLCHVNWQVLVCLHEIDASWLCLCE